MFKSLELIQKVISFSSQMYLHDTLIEVHKFKFGFVIPNTENSWENIIIARPKAEMIPAEVLSGNLIVESEFFNNEKNVYKFKAQVFYDWKQLITKSYIYSSCNNSHSFHFLSSSLAQICQFSWHRR